MIIERLEEIFDEEYFFNDISVPVKRKPTKKFLSKIFKEKDVLVDVSPLIIGHYGIYAFIDNIEDAAQTRAYILHKFKMRENVFVFAELEGGGTYYDADNNTYIDFENLYEGLSAFRQNHKIPECFKHKYKFKTTEDYFEDVYKSLENEEDEDDLYIRPLISNSKLDDIAEILENYDEEPITQGKYIYYPDGSMRVKKFVSSGLMGGSECTFPCSDDNPNKTYWLTVIFGWTGYHKFINGKWGQGLLYLLTCGLMGILPLFDLSSMLFGDYYFTDVNYDMGLDRKVTRSAQRIYMRPLEKKWLCALGILLSLGIIFLVSNFVYTPIVAGLGELLATLAENSNEIQGIVENMPIN